MMTPMEEVSGGANLSVMSLQDETVLLRRHVAKLSRRVNQLEQDSLQRTYREYLFYPVFLGFFIIKVINWFRRGH
jgi:hypothetical protein